MKAALKTMHESFDAEYVSLHVRVSNTAALTLYRDTLGFKQHDIEKQYYADKEDAFDMRKYLTTPSSEESEGEKKRGLIMKILLRSRAAGDDTRRGSR
ncbi:conserved hypothetical protein [Perkinsus marinus ATCC 50983]|uniref:N-acetyltransferase domain-containing protein n=1 Tax=Perkinsus marinus (strain ATCC 50983 / TXsc) TaxID=423536 RepID=C5L413_PERM5|nr:conserved hypothetical protein [Perkinsus marinus ATCC 50983]EER08531.1 conserved hypothetical protein [Perkinsus marinus ATCC 50983]|eukprot:XP_002776715.1 conserved hypothetical protein [Perkinsus marinus ATCC 50983]